VAELVDPASSAKKRRRQRKRGKKGAQRAPALRDFMPRFPPPEVHALGPLASAPFPAAGPDGGRPPPAVKASFEARGREWVKHKSVAKQARNILRMADQEAAEGAARAKGAKRVPPLRPGDVVAAKVEHTVDDTQLGKAQILTGIVIDIRRRGVSSTFTIRNSETNQAEHVGYEVTLPMYSPTVQEVKVLDHVKLGNKNKWYWLRDHDPEESRYERVGAREFSGQGRRQALKDHLAAKRDKKAKKGKK